MKNASNFVFAFAAAGALMIATSASADVAAELTTAQMHAGLAAKAPAIDGMHVHMHHALNCLVGANGDGYDATQMNPCAKQGNGAIPDSTDAAQKAKLETAVGQLKSGIAATDMAAAQKAATDAGATIGSAK